MGCQLPAAQDFYGQRGMSLPLKRTKLEQMLQFIQRRLDPIAPAP